MAISRYLLTRVGSNKMTVQLSLNPDRSAVLSMDYQTGIVAIYGKDDTGPLACAASVLKHARSSDSLA
jgi:6-phosphogluconolactonase (cycloisomerase 2 family)